MQLDLSSVLNLISTIAIVGALIFAALQVRAANRTRHDQAAVTVIQTAQSESWSRALELMETLPDDAKPNDVENLGREAERVIFEFGVRLETIGYMVFRRIVTLDMVDDLMGGVTLVFWSRAGKWAAQKRVQSGNPKYFEWCEWLADRVASRRARLGHDPASRRYSDWRE